MKQKILLTGTCGFIFSNFIRKAIYEKLPYSFVSVDRVTFNTINSIYYNKSHTFHVADIRDQHVMDVIFQFEKPDIVIHAAAETHVDNSLQDPNSFITSNVLGTQVIINECIKHKVKKLIQISCYDEKTRAVTKYGIKSFNELKEGDLVLSINPLTGIVEEKPINKIIIQDYNGDMLLFKNRKMDLFTTPNHRFLYQKENYKTNKFYWSTAEELENNKEKIYLPIGLNSNMEIEPDVKTINLPNIGEVDLKSLFYMCGVFIGNDCTNKKPYFYDNLEYSTCDSYRIYFNIPEKDETRKKIEESLTKLNIKYTTQKNNSGECIYFISKDWLDFFEQYGKYAKNKQIPNWMFSYNQSLLKELWLGIHDANGYVNSIKGRTVNITTISEKLTAQLCYLGSMIGYQTKVCRIFSKSYIDNRLIQEFANVIYFSNCNVKIPFPIRQMYNGKVWCLAVQDNKNFLVERNGNIAFCGNTDEVYGNLTHESDLSWTEESPINPRNPYSASKASSELLVKAAHESHGLEYNITRSCNNYGQYQDASKLIPKVIKCILNNQKIPVYGQGLQIRDWIYVLDNCSGIIKVLNDGKPNEIYNISAGHEITNIELIQKICNTMNKGHELINHIIPDPRPGHDFRYSLDSSKLRKLDWKPQYSLMDGIESTVAWYINNLWYLK